MRSSPPRRSRWLVTLALAGFAGLAIYVAPRLQSPAETESVAERGPCVSVGKFECCYKE